MHINYLYKCIFEIVEQHYNIIIQTKLMDKRFLVWTYSLFLSLCSGIFYSRYDNKIVARIKQRIVYSFTYNIP